VRWLVWVEVSVVSAEAETERQPVNREIGDSPQAPARPHAQGDPRRGPRHRVQATPTDALRPGDGLVYVRRSQPGWAPGTGAGRSRDKLTDAAEANPQPGLAPAQSWVHERERFSFSSPLLAGHVRSAKASTSSILPETMSRSSGSSTVASVA
jgi:hypothetical protein